MIVLADFSSCITVASCSFKAIQLGQFVSSTSLSNEHLFSRGSAETHKSAAINILLFADYELRNTNITSIMRDCVIPQLVMHLLAKSK